MGNKESSSLAEGKGNHVLLQKRDLEKFQDSKGTKQPNGYQPTTTSPLKFLKRYRQEREYFKTSISENYHPKRLFSIQSFCLIQPTQEIRSKNGKHRNVNQEKCQKEIETREQIMNTLEFPFSSVGRIFMKFDGQKFQGSGALISKNIVLTCAHNCYDPLLNVEATEIQFWPGLRNLKGRRFKVQAFYYPSQYKQVSDEEKENFDYAILILKQNVGEMYGYFGVDFEGTYSGKVTIAGYPSFILKDKQQFRVHNKMFKEEGVFEQQNSERIKYTISTTCGQSGSPIYRIIDNQYYIIGIHTNGESAFNSGVFLNPQKRLMINSLINITSGKLYLDELGIGDKGIKQLAQITIRQQQTLKQQLQSVSNSSIPYISSKNWMDIGQLFLKYNNLNDEGIKTLVTINFPQLEYLYLNSNNITSLGADYLSTANEKWKILKQLQLKGNKICDKGAMLLINKLWNMLRILDLNDNLITGAVERYLLSHQQQQFHNSHHQLLKISIKSSVLSESLTMFKGIQKQPEQEIETNIQQKIQQEQEKMHTQEDQNIKSSQFSSMTMKKKKKKTLKYKQK